MKKLSLSEFMLLNLLGGIGSFFRKDAVVRLRWELCERDDKEHQNNTRDVFNLKALLNEGEAEKSIRSLIEKKLIEERRNILYITESGLRFLWNLKNSTFFTFISRAFEGFDKANGKKFSTVKEVIENRNKN